MDEEVADAVETIVKESKSLVPVVVGLLAFGAGVGLGYILGRRKSVEVITLAPRDPELKENRPPKVVVDERPKKLMTTEELKQSYADDPQVEVITLNDQKVESSNVFANSTIDEDEWDIKKEIETRSPHRPYVLHQEEFFAEEMESEDFIQSTLIYYAGDDVLVDQEEKILYNRAELVGDCLNKFGHGSGDPNTVYVRSMEQRMEYEVIRDPGHYSVEVQGLEMEHEENAQDLKHARAPRKFRPE
jgi:hypothetical protein